MVYTLFKAYPMVALKYVSGAIGRIVPAKGVLNQDWHLMLALNIAKTFNTLALEMAKIVSVLISFLL